MISYIKTKRGHSESDNIFIIEYNVKDNKLEYKFDVDVSNYGYQIIGIKAQSDEDVHLTDRLDVIDEQGDFVNASSILSDLGKLLEADISISLEEKIEIIKKEIDNLCTKWNLINS